MKGSHAVAKQAHALTAQAETIADVSRKVDLILAHLGISAVPPDPRKDAEVDAKAAEAAGSVPTREEALKAQGIPPKSAIRKR